MYRYQQVICRTASSEYETDVSICFPEKYLSPDEWDIGQWSDKQRGSLPGSAKTAGLVWKYTVENIFICLGRVLQEHLYLSWRTRRVKEWLSGLQWVTQPWDHRGLKQQWQKLRLNWKVSKGLFLFSNLWSMKARSAFMLQKLCLTTFIRAHLPTSYSIQAKYV